MMQALTIAFCMLTSIGYTQSFFIEPTNKGYERKISEKLHYDGYKLTEIKDSSDYTLICLVRQTSKINSMYKGYVRVENSRTGTEVARTKEVRRGAVAVNGFNAGANIFEVIARKELIPIIEKLKTQ